MAASKTLALLLVAMMVSASMAAPLRQPGERHGGAPRAPVHLRQLPGPKSVHQRPTGGMVQHPCNFCCYEALCGAVHARTRAALDARCTRAPVCFQTLRRAPLSSAYAPNPAAPIPRPPPG